MIVTALVTIILSFFSFILALLPTFAGPNTSTWSSFSADFGTKVSYASHWFNIPLMVTLLGLFVGILAAFTTVKLILWVYARLPWIGRGDD